MLKTQIVTEELETGTQFCEMSPLLQQAQPDGALPSESSGQHLAIAELAYSYWEARGRRVGAQEEDWFRAEAEVKRRSGLTQATNGHDGTGVLGGGQD